MSVCLLQTVLGRRCLRVTHYSSVRSFVRSWAATARSTYRTWGWYAYPVRTVRGPGPWGKPPCASGTYTTREAGKRSPYVPYEGPGACVSAQAVGSMLRAGEHQKLFSIVKALTHQRSKGHAFMMMSSAPA